MSDKPFDRQVINVREKPLSSDMNLFESYLERAFRETIDRLTTQRISGANSASQVTPDTAFAGDGFKPLASSPVGMSIALTPGLGFFGDTADLPTAIGGIIGVDDRQRMKPLVLSALQTLIVPANGAGANRIDIVEVKVRRSLIDPTSRDILDPGTGNFVAGLVNKTLTWDLLAQQGQVVSPANNTTPIGYKVGIAGAGAPAPSPGYTKIAEITIIPGALQINQVDILDGRRTLNLTGQHVVSVVYSYDPLTGVTTLLEYAAPAGFDSPVVGGSIHSNGRMTVVVQLRAGGLPLGGFSTNRATINTTMDILSNLLMGVCSNRFITAPGGNPIGVTVQAMVLQINVGVLNTALASPPPSPIIFRTVITFW